MNRDTGYKRKLQNLLLILSITGVLTAFGYRCLNPAMVYSESLPRLKPDIGGVCLECHKGLKEGSSNAKAHKPFDSGACIECHTPHAAKNKELLLRLGGQLCYECHKDKDIWIIEKQRHEPIENGECITCHRPHGSDFDNLLVAEGEGLCYICHDKGLFSKSYIHGPVKKGECGECHRAHLSDFPFMLKQKVPDICLDCHRQIPGHSQMEIKKADCMQCHNPHSSERKRLLYTVSHRPYARNKCDECHKAAIVTTEAIPGDAALCYKCHEEEKKRFNTKEKTHILPGRRECTICHNPHGSERKDLVKRGDAPLCIACHKEIGTRLKSEKGIKRHPEVIAGRCSTCHDSHSSDNDFFLKEGINAICLSCHKRQKVFCHPLGKKAIDPRDKTPIVCLTCHNPMGTQFPYILRLSGEEALCKQCHKY